MLSAELQIEKIYEELTGLHDPGSPSSRERPLEPQSSQPEPLRNTIIKQEVKPIIKPEPILPPTETDEQIAARLQREFDAENTRGRASRSAGLQKKKPVKKRKSKATVGSDEEGGTPKKRRGGGGGAFNKEMVLR